MFEKFYHDLVKLWGGSPATKSLTCSISSEDINLLSVYYAVFHSHLAYHYLVWGQAKFSLNRITLLQKRAFGIIHSAIYRNHNCPLFHRCKILKLIDIASLQKIVYLAINASTTALFPCFQITLN